MHKTLSVLLLVGFIISSIKADGTNQPPVSQISQVGSDTPQNSYLQAASYPNSDNIPILNNPAYDPNIIANFFPPDSVQRYVQNIGGHAMEGFLVPTYQETQLAPSSPSYVNIFKSFVPGSKIIVAVLAKIVAVIASAIGVVFFGGAVTSFICAFTPLCTLTFVGAPLSLLRKETKEIAEKIASEVTPERIKRAADLLQLAYDKYQKMQNE